MHIHWILTKEEEKARVAEFKKLFPACPVCGRQFEHDPFWSAYNGPTGAIEVSLHGYYGSAKHDMEGGSTFVCDDCADILFALLGVKRGWPEDSEDGARLKALRDALLPEILKAIRR